MEDKIYKISVGVVTKGEKFADRLIGKLHQLTYNYGWQLVICGDGDKGFQLAKKYADNYDRIDAGYFEKGWNTVLSLVKHQWVLQIDDDEEISPAMEKWLCKGEWQHLGKDGFAFPCAWTFGDKQHYLMNDPVGHDSHIRLLKKQYSGREELPHSVPQRCRVAMTPYMILHHKFLVRSLEDRVATARKYEAMGEGLGFGKRLAYNVPEIVFREYEIGEVGEGKVEYERLHDYIR